MSLRRLLGRDVRHVHALVDQALDGEDAVIVILDGQRGVSYADGFGLSPCQLELFTNHIERMLQLLTRKGRHPQEVFRPPELLTRNGCEGEEVA
ncbi:MAG: hypothetical protein AB7O67_04905 [Vicinamibacterales bacterium]